MSHSVRKYNVQPVRMLHGNHDRQPRPLADEQPRVTRRNSFQYQLPSLVVDRAEVIRRTVSAGTGAAVCSAKR
jgi:hypothetical protein